MDCQGSDGTCQRDELLGLLADRHRRATIRYFRASAADVASVSDLAEAISEDDQRGRQHVTVRLRHAVLPKLDEMGVVEYDPRRSSVRFRGRHDLDVLLDALEDL